ncbi:sensor histidine kinase [Planotetraspora sp. A-T 1434]|uniref:sensor histidine kinase n=1 Tax=Planotetraspora sp. A-T 1434 TaxID=2979219 RepID=UPI0021C09ECF|nr:sensor histidine kinase [Planotetraspora sp. A-T 1434]MCT9929088.1 sensor histidine kinase [Planotetraspora sp. A-T 1434]
MPDDLPLEEPPGRMTTVAEPSTGAREVSRPHGPLSAARRRAVAALSPTAFGGRGLTPGLVDADGSSGAHAWQTFRGWETLFGLSLAVTVLFVTLDDGVPVTGRVTTVLLLAACALAYVLLGRPAIVEDEDDSRRGLLYCGLLIAAFVPACLIVPAASFGLFALCPQIFMLLRARNAVVMVLILNLAPAARFLTQPMLDRSDVLMFAGTAAIAITFTLVFGPWITRIIHQSAERAHLIEELEASRAEVARLSSERGALAERERLAGEIHDTLAQGFTSIIMLIQAAEAQADPSHLLGLAVQTARENLAEARVLIAALSPAPLDGSTLDEALRRVTSRLGEELGIEASFTAAGPSRPLPPSTEVVLIRAAQEGLANVRKHAAASSMAVSIEYGPAEVALTVRDDGVGFRVGTCQGYGLRAMRTRIEQEGGTVTVDTSPGHGTTLTVIMHPTPPPA